MDKKVLIIEEKENPSTDFYLLSFFKYAGLNYIRVNYNDIHKFPYADFVFIVRYVSSEVIEWVEKIKPERVFYLVDDDILDIKSLINLPYSYAWKIFSKTFFYRNWIKNNTTILVPHETLKNKYKEYNVYVLPPNPVWVDNPNFRAVVNPFVVFYHATASHVGEYVWLSELIRKNKKDYLHFEVIAGKNYDKIFKNLNNTWIVRQMKWNSYKEFLKLSYRTVSLAINLPNQFNLMRSYTKFFNNLYAGVSGIYCENFPIAELIKEYNAGFVLNLDHKEWLSTLNFVYENPQIMEEHFENSLKLLYDLRKYAISCYDIIFKDI